MIDFTFYDMELGTQLHPVTPHMSHTPVNPIAYMDEVAFAALELGYISGPTLNVAHHAETRH